jgi:LCP family protein required for cell wall assembly
MAVRVGSNLDALLFTPVPVAVAPPVLPTPGVAMRPQATATAHAVPAKHERSRYGGLYDDETGDLSIGSAPLAATREAAAPSSQPTLTVQGPFVPQMEDARPPLVAVLPTPVALPSIIAAPVHPAQSAPMPPGASASSSDAATILLLGTDRRPGESGIPRTDAVMLLRLDPGRQRVALLSFPRDLWVPIPGFGLNRINSAFVWGEYYGWPGGGWALARDTVSNLIDAPIDHVVMVDFESFIRIIDAIGGITVNVEQELYDAFYPTMNYGYTVAYFPVGEQMMDGAAALKYSRIRHPDSDFERVRRQQSVMLAIGQKLRERGDLRNLLDAEALSEALVGNVQTDMPRARMVELAWSMRTIDLGRVERYSVSSAMVSRGADNDAYALVPNQAQLRHLADQFLFGQPMP